MLIKLLIVFIVISLLYLFSKLYKRSIKGTIVQSREGKYIILKTIGKYPVGFKIRAAYDDKELFHFKHKKKKYTADFWTLSEIDAVKVDEDITIIQYFMMLHKYKKFIKIYEDIDDYLLSSRASYLKNGFYYSFGYKKFKLDQILMRTDKEFEKTVNLLKEWLPENAKEYDAALKAYQKKEYDYLLEFVSLVDLTGKSLFDVQIFSNNRNKNMYQVMEHYASIDFYSFILNNPIICSKRSRLSSDTIINRHRLVHDLYKKYYTKENYLRIVNLLIAMVHVKKSEHEEI